MSHSADERVPSRTGDFHEPRSLPLTAARPDPINLANRSQSCRRGGGWIADATPSKGQGSFSSACMKRNVGTCWCCSSSLPLSGPCEAPWATFSLFLLHGEVTLLQSPDKRRRRIQHGCCLLAIPLQIVVPPPRLLQYGEPRGPARCRIAAPDWWRNSTSIAHRS